ncbi:nidogen-2 [Carettochelys insculpta]|uniref:nidogen-2 n=1 Tax=Carettochelys insculpta TaxID=44489 RepID=UPI003EBAF004
MVARGRGETPPRPGPRPARLGGAGSGSGAGIAAAREGTRAAPSMPAGGLAALRLLLVLGWAAALPRRELLPYGAPRGDRLLPDGDDESSAAVPLGRPLRFYEARFGQLYVGTNGLISTQDFPRETQYVDDDFPTDFPAIAPFLSDIDTSRGRGKIYYREEESPEVLAQAARLVHAGFPGAAAFAPTRAFIATWENVGAYEEVPGSAEPSGKLNTFQAVLAYDDSDTYALFLYPIDGLHFFGTRPKESYNVHLELPARVGFSRGESADLKREGPFYSVTSSEQAVKNLYQTSNVGIPGIWAFHIGSSSSLLDNVVPARVGEKPLEDHSQEPLESTLGGTALEQNILDADYPEENIDYAEIFYDENEDEDIEYLTEPVPDLYSEPRHSGARLGLELESTLPSLVPSHHPAFPEVKSLPSSPGRQEGSSQEPPALQGEAESSQETGFRSLSSPETSNSLLELTTEGLPAGPKKDKAWSYPDGGTVTPEVDIFPAYPEGEVVLRSYPKNSPPPHRGRQVVGVDEDGSFNPEGFTYNTASKETCERNHSQCSQHAFCTDYATGFCCHCQSRFYGNGRHCLPEGAAHRLNGKVSGDLLVGQTPVRFGGVDLHAYVVGNDGRAYTAISHVPQPAARALVPLTPIGGLFGWLFALEKPGYENGFSITGAEFTHNLEVTFYPGEEKVRITQTADGLGPENYLSIKTHIEGQLPFIPENFAVHIAPYKELYHYSSSAVTSTAYRQYFLISGSVNRTLAYRLHQNITFQDCLPARHRWAVPAIQQLSVDRIFALYNNEERVLRYAITNQIGSSQGGTEVGVVNPCYDGTHACDTTARCQPGTGLAYTCECTAGYRGDGRDCVDIDECAESFGRCGHRSVCVNSPGSYRCECPSGYQLAADRRACVPIPPPSNPCEDGSHTCASADRARCVHHGGGSFSCVCLAGYTGNGQNCSDVDECAERRCHQAAVCDNTPGSFSCRCQPGYQGDGFQCTPEAAQQLTPCEQERLYPKPAQGLQGVAGPLGLHVPQCDEQGNYRPLQCHGSTGFCWCVDGAGQEIAGSRSPPGTAPLRCRTPEPTQRPQTMCERWRQSLLEHYGGRPREDQYVPQCDALGSFHPLQCHGTSGYCWCVDESGREVHGTRSEPGVPPPCLPSVAPPIVQPTLRPDVTPLTAGTFLLYAQGQQIGYLPLNGTRLQKEMAKTLLSLHGSIVVGLDYDCREKMAYWTDVAGRTVNRASLEPGAEPETIINSGLMSPEGLTVDHFRRTMFWTDSGLDKIERARLDGSERRVLFDTDLVNPRAITVDAVRGNLYWTDWNREAPKIETSTVDGANRRILVNEDIGLPNGLTFDPFSKLICWADAGTKKLECTLPDGTGRRVIQNNLNYPFSIVSYANHFYHTDWRRDGVIAVNKDSGFLTDEYLPEQRSHLYGITAVYPYCPGARK